MENKNLPQEEANIKRLLQSTFDQEGFDLNIEDEILFKVQTQSDRNKQIAELRRKAKITISIATIFFVIFIIQSYQWLVPTSNGNLEETGASIIGTLLFAVAGIFLLFFQGILLAGSKNHI